MKIKMPWSKPAPEASNPADNPTPVRPEDFVGTDQSRNEQMAREGFVAKAKSCLRRLPIAEEVVALYFCLLDNKTPLWVKGIAATALAYFILPLDAVPDILPVIGLGDDLSVLSAALAAVSTNLTSEHRAKARQWLAHEHLVGAGADWH